MRSALSRLQVWYQSQCGERWEEYYGVRIETLDNPGWSVDIDLVGTPLEHVPLEATSYGVGREADQSGDEWMTCRSEAGLFEGRGGPLKLEEILGVFLSWAERPAG